jgi:hypothetical protein
MDIIPGEIDGFELHPLDKGSTHPALANNRIDDGFLWLSVLAFKHSLLNNKSNRGT